MALTIAPSLVPVFVQDFTISRYFQAATMASLTYDSAITMDREITYFWKLPFTSISFVYFANRYSGIFGEISGVIYYSYQLSPSVCKSMIWTFIQGQGAKKTAGKFAMWTRVISDWFTIVLIDYILMIRILALYSREKVLSWILQALLALEAVAMLWLVIQITVVEGLTTKTLPGGITVCGETHNAQGLGMAFWSIPMVYSTVLFALALYKAIEFWLINRGFEGLTLVRVLIEDQAIYFVLAIVCNLLNVMEFKLRVSNGLLSALLDTLGSPAFLCVFGSRMLFNLKEAGEKGSYDDETTLRMDTRMSSVRFASSYRG
ncbi:hypothetical protein ACEPAH_5262 [Sanghuangporus vaninii]